MTSFRIERGPFAAAQIESWAQLDPRFRNWPVVYALDGEDRIYVGESLNVATRFRQHLASPEKRQLKGARVVLDPTFNKSVCLDLEAFLIQRLSGDGTYQVTNRNVGISDRDYYGREEYQRISFTDEDILGLVENIYAVLLTRGMLGTYVYVCDTALRERLRPYFSAVTG